MPKFIVVFEYNVTSMGRIEVEADTPEQAVAEVEGMTLDDLDPHVNNTEHAGECADAWIADDDTNTDEDGSDENSAN